MKTLILLVCLVTNKTEKPIVELYCTPAFSELSGDDLLHRAEEGRITIEQGETRRLFFESDLYSKFWDLVAVDNTGDIYRFYALEKDKLQVTITSTKRSRPEDDIFDDFDPFAEEALFDDGEGFEALDEWE